MNYSEKWGTDVEEAVRLALIDLKLTRKDVEVTILEEPSKGFFGIGSKLAKVRVEKKKAEKKKAAQKPAAEKTLAPTPTPVSKKKKENKPARKATVAEETKENKTTITGEPVEDLVPLREHETISFLKETTEKMGLSLEITAKEGKEAIYIHINGKDAGTVIGKRGQTLDAIQYLTNLIANKEKAKRTRVVVDAEHYRERRERTLEQLANRLADKAIRTRRSVRLEPMNPYERKVIHATLQQNGRVVTKSEGQEPYRRVIIELK